MASHEGFGYDTGIAEEEDLLAFGVRRSLQLTNGIEYITDILGDSYSVDFAWHFPTAQSKIIAAFSSILQNEESALTKHTRLPFYERFLEAEKHQLLLHHSLGCAVPGISTSIYSGKFLGQMALCLKCRDERANFAIWDRLFLMPGIFTCDKHDQELVTFCTTCSSGLRNSKAWRPPYKCKCPRGLEKVAKLDARARQYSVFISRVARQIINNSAPTSLNGRSIRAAIIRNITSTKYRSSSLLKAVAFQAGGENFLTAYQLGDKTFERASMENGESLRNPIQLLALAAVLFGDMETLLNAVATDVPIADLFPTALEARKLIIRRRPVRPNNEIVGFEKLEDSREVMEKSKKFRKGIMLLLKKNKQITRNDLAKITGALKLLNHLRRYDNEWLEKVLPGKFSKVRKVLNSKSERDALIRKIREQRKSLLEDEPKKFVTITRLLAFTSHRHKRNSLWSYPDIAQALEECIDTEKSWQLRAAALFVEEVRQISPESRFADVSRYLHENRTGFNNKLRWATAKLKLENS